MDFRFLCTGHNSAYYNMAADEAILYCVSNKKSLPTLRFYGWTPSAVSIGYFQSMDDEIDVSKCKKEKISFIRRITGGGAVFHEHELTYSFICKESFLPKNILESYKKICGAVIAGIKKLGGKAVFVPLNDIIINNQKISGNAQTRKFGCVLQHGTILINVNVEKMFSLLRIPNEKIKDKMIKTAKRRVSSLNALLKQNFSFRDIEDAIFFGFRKTFSNILFKKDSLSRDEKELTGKLIKEKYQTYNWNFKR